MTLLQACLNGSRTSDEHPAIPRTPAELATEGRAAVEADAQVLHLHAYDRDGGETFAAGPTTAALQAVRAACPGVPISLSTSADIETHPLRLQSIARWTDLPDLVTANQGEAGIVELCDLLTERGVRIEAGLLHLDNVRRFAYSGLAERCAFYSNAGRGSHRGRRARRRDGARSRRRWGDSGTGPSRRRRRHLACHGSGCAAGPRNTRGSRGHYEAPGRTARCGQRLARQVGR